jgi:hypothetical protein
MWPAPTGFGQTGPLKIEADGPPARRLNPGQNVQVRDSAA